MTRSFTPRTLSLFAAALLALGTTAPALAQNSPTTVSGRVIDQLTHAPVAFASIGVLHQPVGTITDEQGRFTLALPTAYDQDSLRLTFLGYAPLTVQVAAFRQQLARSNGQVTLQPAPIQLAEVLVQGSKPRRQQGSSPAISAVLR